MELPNIAAYAYQDVHVWSALLTCLRPLNPTLALAPSVEVPKCRAMMWINDVDPPLPMGPLANG